MMRAMQDSFRNADLSDISFLIINSMNSSSGFQSLTTTAGNIPVHQDNSSSRTWSNLQGATDDIFVYDRCGKLAFYLPYPLSLASEPYIKTALLSAYYDSPCGPCTPVQPEPQLITNCTLNPADNTTQLCHVDVIYSASSSNTNSTNHVIDIAKPPNSNDGNTNLEQEKDLPISVLGYEIYNNNFEKKSVDLENNENSTRSLIGLLKQISRNDINFDKLNDLSPLENKTLKENNNSTEENQEELLEEDNKINKTHAEIFRDILCNVTDYQIALEQLKQWFHMRNSPSSSKRVTEHDKENVNGYLLVNSAEVNDNERVEEEEEVNEEGNTEKIEKKEHHPHRHHHELPRGKHRKSKNTIKKVDIPVSRHIDQTQESELNVNTTATPEQVQQNKTINEGRSDDLLTSCPDLNRRRCETMTSKFLRARHCCHLIIKSEMKGESVLPAKCRELSPEKCTKLRAYHKCCQEDMKLTEMKNKMQETEQEEKSNEQIKEAVENDATQNGSNFGINSPL